MLNLFGPEKLRIFAISIDDGCVGKKLGEHFAAAAARLDDSHRNMLLQEKMGEMDRCRGPSNEDDGVNAMLQRMENFMKPIDHLSFPCYRHLIARQKEIFSMGKKDLFLMHQFPPNQTNDQLLRQF